MRIGKYEIHIDMLWDKEKRKRLQARATEREVNLGGRDDDNLPEEGVRIYRGLEGSGQESGEERELTEYERRIRERRTADEAWKARETQNTRSNGIPERKKVQSAREESPGEGGGEVVRFRLRSSRREQGPAAGCFLALVYVIFILSASILIAGFGWILACDVLGFMKEERVETVRVGEADRVADVAVLLTEHGIIDYPWLFKLYAKITRVEEENKIDPGSYSIEVGWDYNAIVRAMRAGAPEREVVRVSVPEGYTQEQILRLLAERSVAEYDDLQAVAREHDFSYDFLEGLPVSDNRLEGYLFPDTYDFFVGENPVTALNKLLANFNRKFTDAMRNLTDDSGLSIHEIVTIASMIEREAQHDEERPTISSVIYNRLGNPENFPFLQIDATVQYTLPEHRETLTTEDLETDSPYNTYEYPGLPPGPIACPGIAALRAALRPEETGYYYYVLYEDGYHLFGRTLAEHEANVETARQNMTAG